MTDKSDRRRAREKIIAELKGGERLIYEVLRTYPSMLRTLSALTEKQLELALRIEKANLRRRTFIERITMRLNKVRSQRAHAQSKML